MDQALGKRVLAVSEKVIANFDRGNWEEVGLLTGETDLITGHHRLLRSLHWQDEDYDGNALTVLRALTEKNPKNLAIIEQYVNDRFPGASEYISAQPAERKISFAPHV